MSGPMIALAGTGGAGGGGGGGGGSKTPAALNWADIWGAGGFGSTNTLTVTGIGVPISISVAKTGGGSLQYILNGVATGYTGQFLVHLNDTLAFSITLGGALEKAGTLTVVNVTDSNTTLKAINYDVSP